MQWPGTAYMALCGLRLVVLQVCVTLQLVATECAMLEDACADSVEAIVGGDKAHISQRRKVEMAYRMRRQTLTL